MSALLSLREYQEILMLDLTKYRNLGLFKHGWYVEMDEPYNLHRDLYIFYFDEEGFPTRVGMLTSADAVIDELLHVQVEVIESNTYFLLQLDLQVSSFHS